MLKNLIALMIALTIASPARADSIAEVADIATPRLGMLERGDIGGYVAAFAENAVFHSALSPFRVEGRSAIRAMFVTLTENYPRRRVLVRQPVMRAYGDNVVVQNAYSVLYLTTQVGNIEVVPSRSSTTWVKLEGRWQIVDQHVSPLPRTP